MDRLTPYCKDCRYFELEVRGCNHENNIKVSLITGEYVRNHSCDYLRELGCGIEGKWFQPKVEMGVKDE